MKPTSYYEIYDLFLRKINDFFILNQLENNIEFANDLLMGYLRSAIPKFTYSSKDLSKRNDELFQFEYTLTDMEKEILAVLMIVEYLSPKIIRDEFLENRLGSKDYNEFSPANQLKQLRELSKGVMDDANLLMIEYYYRQGV